MAVESVSVECRMSGSSTAAVSPAPIARTRERETKRPRSGGDVQGQPPGQDGISEPTTTGTICATR